MDILCHFIIPELNLDLILPLKQIIFNLSYQVLKIIETGCS